MIALLTACLVFEILVHVLNCISKSTRENCVARVTTFVTNFVTQQNTVLIASLRNVTRIGQSCVIEDGSFFKIIKRFDELSLRLLAVILFLIFPSSEVLSA